MSIIRFDRDDPSAAGRYLAGHLTDEECEAFEAELLRNPEKVRELEATARLKVGLETLRESGELTEALRPRQVNPRPVALAVAAALVLFVLGVVLFQRTFVRNPPPLLASTSALLVDAQGSALPVSGPVAVFRKRASAYDAVIELPPTRQAIALRVLPQPTGDAPSSVASGYTVSIARLKEDHPGEPAETVPSVKADPDGFLTVYVNAARLAPGRYRLVVSGEARGSTPAEDTFRLNVVPIKTVE